AQLRFFLWRHERLHIVADASIRRADPGDPLLEAIAMNLIVMDRDEGGVNRDETELAAHGAGVQQGRFAEAEHRYVDRGARVVKADVLEVVHVKSGIALPLRRNRAADDRAGDARFR